MSQGRKILIAVAAGWGVVLGVTVATSAIDPFNAAGDDPRARNFGFTLDRMTGIVAED